MVLMSVDFPRPVCPAFQTVTDRPARFRTRRRTNDNDIELEPAFQELVLDLRGNGVETDVGSGTNFFDCSGGHVVKERRKSGQKNEILAVDAKQSN